MSNNTQPVRLAMIGCGGMARHHVRRILQQQESTKVVATCEPSGQAYEEFCALFEQAGVMPPPNEPNLARLLQERSGEIDAAFIVTPHVLHHDQAVACLEAGIDVLLEKPMVMSAAEAEDLIAVRDRTGRLLVVSFNGSLSPQIRTAVKMLRSGALGKILNVHGVSWQNWKGLTTGTWRQNPVMSGGGFFFDTGAHLLNTVSDLVGEEYSEVTAWLDNRGAPVDIVGSVMARTVSGILVALSGCGDTIKGAGSDVRVFCSEGILRTGAAGERLEVQRNGQQRLMPVRVPASLGQWEQFLKVRAGQIANPCPPEIGLRMARLWDAIQRSAAQGGQPLHI